jgi:hypothetical protein
MNAGISVCVLVFVCAEMATKQQAIEKKEETNTNTEVYLPLNLPRGLLEVGPATMKPKKKKRESPLQVYLQCV